jgi:hypothetical protein
LLAATLPTFHFFAFALLPSSAFVVFLLLLVVVVVVV